MKQEVIKELSTAEVIERIEDQREQFAKLKLNHAISPIENPQRIKETRRTIARLETELRKRQLEEAK
jgi:large subunit ribosomal protein L29